MVKPEAGELICNTLMKGKKEGENITEKKAKLKEREEMKGNQPWVSKETYWRGDILTTGLISDFHSLALSLLLI